MPTVANASSAALCAMASTIRTPGITGRVGKWPVKYGSLIVTFLSVRMVLPGSSESTRSTSRIG